MTTTKAKDEHQKELLEKIIAELQRLNKLMEDQQKQATEQYNIFQKEKDRNLITGKALSK